ncbi:hypothetical protein F5Y10DRAFT_185573 [Nemania abortiva]|nr:hypothetical protein F5Y10DRAFT_185573 [Nemania abortiva]
MDSSLHEIWNSASGSPFKPTVGKGSQFLVGFVLLLVGLGLTGGFAFSACWTNLVHAMRQFVGCDADKLYTDRSLVNLPIYGVPAGLAIACVSNPCPQIYHLFSQLGSDLFNSFGTVYMFCAVGVYV